MNILNVLPSEVADQPKGGNYKAEETLKQRLDVHVQRVNQDYEWQVEAGTARVRKQSAGHDVKFIVNRY
jgi:hypothetical protein